MRFYNHINEGVTTKFFDLIKNPAKTTFKELMSAFKKELGVHLVFEFDDGVKKEFKKNPENTFFPGAHNWITSTIKIFIPNSFGLIKDKTLDFYPINLVGTIIHELGHHFQDHSKEVFREYRMSPANDPNGQLLSTFHYQVQYVDYFLQPTERPQMVVSICFDLLLRGLTEKDFINDLKDIKARKGMKFESTIDADIFLGKKNAEIRRKYGESNAASILGTLLYVYVYTAANNLLEYPGNVEPVKKIDAQLKALIRSIGKHFSEIKKFKKYFK